MILMRYADVDGNELTPLTVGGVFEMMRRRMKRMPPGLVASFVLVRLLS